VDQVIFFPVGSSGVALMKKQPIDRLPGRRLAQLRKDRGLSQAQLAEKLKMTRFAVINYELGKTELRATVISQLAHALECKSTDLIAETEA
jgi:transcriptional regulator with XRE-family HTH domain